MVTFASVKGQHRSVVGNICFALQKLQLHKEKVKLQYHLKKRESCCWFVYVGFDMAGMFASKTDYLYFNMLNRDWEEHDQKWFDYLFESTNAGEEGSVMRAEMCLESKGTVKLSFIQTG